MTEIHDKPPVEHGPSTQAVHGGRDEMPGPVVQPIVQSSTFAFADHNAMLEAFEAKEKGLVYTRYSNPTIENCERRLAVIEGAEDAWLFGSGMAAITSAVLSQVKAGDSVAVQREVYGGTFEFFGAIAPTLGLEVEWFSGTDPEEYEKALESRPTLVYLETPTNPLLSCVDLKARAGAARAVGAVTIVDSTFGTPFNQQPIDLGIDIVVHSATKYLAGHTDLIAGCVMGKAERLKTVWKYRKLFGGVIDPQAAFLLERSLRTFAVRMEAHNRNGGEIARFLEGHPFVERVYYPGLANHPDHAVARSQMKDFGGMVSVTLKTDLAGVIRFAESLRLFRFAASLGGVESLISIPATSSHFALTAKEREAIGVPDGMARLSLGIEDAKDLIQDLEQALEKTQKVSNTEAVTKPNP